MAKKKNKGERAVRLPISDYYRGIQTCTRATWLIEGLLLQCYRTSRYYLIDSFNESMNGTITTVNVRFCPIEQDPILVPGTTLIEPSALNWEHPESGLVNVLPHELIKCPIVGHYDFTPGQLMGFLNDTP